MTEIGLSALQLDRNLDGLQAFAYALTFKGDGLDEMDAVRLTRRGASQLSFANRRAAVTGLGDYRAVSLKPLEIRDTDWHGIICRAGDGQPVTLHCTDEAQREAIKRLLNQCLAQGARRLALDSNGRLGADTNSSGLAELSDTVPSARIPLRGQYLDAYQTVTLAAEVLPGGVALACIGVRHRLAAHDHVTLEWVIRHRPEWVGCIKRVRHRYATHGRQPLTAELLGIAEGITPLSTISTPDGETSLWDYHMQRGNIRENEGSAVQESHVVNLRYGKNKDACWHFAALLQPMFDFETLQRIDSPLLEKLAMHLKWPVGDRLKKAAETVKGMLAGDLDAGLVAIRETGIYTRHLKPPIRLLFADGHDGDNEKAILRHGAYKGMTRRQIIPIAVAADEGEWIGARRHFLAVKGICQKWAQDSDSPSWSQPARIESADELDARLTRNAPADAMLLVAMGRGADKRAIRNAAFRYGLATQFMRLDHKSGTYQPPYYNNLAAGLFSKGGGMICGLGEMPGDTDLFIGLDLGGIGQRAPGLAFLFTREGAQLGWQLADAQQGERVADRVLRELLERSLRAFMRSGGGIPPRRIALHRDGLLYESLDVVRGFERDHGIGVDVLEVLKSGCPPLYRRTLNSEGRASYANPEVGDAFELAGLDELIIATYSGAELGRGWGDRVTVRPLRLRKRHGDTDLHTLARQVVLLSRIHGASLYRHPRLPVTTHHADRFATLRQECNLDDLSKMDRFCPVYL